MRNATPPSAAATPCRQARHPTGAGSLHRDRRPLVRRWGLHLRRPRAQAPGAAAAAARAGNSPLGQPAPRHRSVLTVAATEQPRGIGSRCCGGHAPRGRGRVGQGVSLNPPSLLFPGRARWTRPHRPPHGGGGIRPPALPVLRLAIVCPPTHRSRACSAGVRVVPFPLSPQGNCTRSVQASSSRHAAGACQTDLARTAAAVNPSAG
jgi:hypothetical protein